MSPIRETAGDRQNEMLLASAYAATLAESNRGYRYRAERNRQFYPLDFAMIIDGIEGRPKDWVAFLFEIKCRRQWYPTMWVPLTKIVFAQSLAEAGGKSKFCWAVREGDIWRVRVWLYRSKLWQMAWGGRDDRDSTQDHEAVAQIPTAEITEEYMVAIQK